MAVHHHETPILIIGAGPAGLILALQLARHGTPCLLAERNVETTKWPKMDITNCRSMEIFRSLGIADEYRDQGVGQDWPFDVLFSTGLSDGGQAVAKWKLPSPNEYRELIKANNDGSMPREPYQRCSQVVLEAWLKPKLQAEPLITSHFGLKFESLVELDDGVQSTLTHLKTGEKHVVKSRYVVGCDGANSRVRSSIGAKLVGHTLYGNMCLVHFKSRDLATLRKQGTAWHIFFSAGGVLIAQDEHDTWTIHLPIPPDTPLDTIDPLQAISLALGGSAGPCRLNVDEVLVKSTYRPKIYVADTYASPSNRVFIAGDAAHQNMPTGGYGMNTAVGDSFDLGWKLAAVYRGHGGPRLLASYDLERRPVGARNVLRADAHHKVHRDYCRWVRAGGHDVAVADSDEGRALRARMARHVSLYDGENREHGVEMDYRYTGSHIVVPDLDAVGPAWDPRVYRPSTFPGTRAPHVFLGDGETSIHDLFGPDFTVVDFSRTGEVSRELESSSRELNVPLKRVHLPDEAHAARIWEREVVLVRPDHHVAWRSPTHVSTPIDAMRILQVVTGHECGGERRNAISKI